MLPRILEAFTSEMTPPQPWTLKYSLFFKVQTLKPAGQLLGSS